MNAGERKELNGGEVEPLPKGLCEVSLEPADISRRREGDLVVAGLAITAGSSRDGGRCP